MTNHATTELLTSIELLADQEKPVVEVINASGKSAIILVCEHASNSVPLYFNHLGLSEDVLQSHIAWDPGAKQVAEQLSLKFDATLVSSRVSRLVYDSNRPPDSDSAMPTKSEIHEIPGNKNISPDEKMARIAQIYQPFQTRLAQAIAAKKSEGITPILVTVHSFTPVYFGQKRAVELGVLHSENDSQFADAVLDASSGISDLIIERNQPYGPQDGVSHTLIEHGVNNAIPNVMLEIRNDLIATPEQVGRISTKIRFMIDAAINELGLNKQ